VKCDGGNKTRTRTGTPALYGGLCPDTASNDTTECNGDPCVPAFPGRLSAPWVIVILVLLVVFMLMSIVLLVKILTTPADIEKSSDRYVQL